MHIAASVGYFIEYIMMHGTININSLTVVCTEVLVYILRVCFVTRLSACDEVSRYTSSEHAHCVLR